jgi:hypothetical protein
MKTHIAAIRAITSEFAQQFVRPFLWIALGIVLTLLIIVGLLAFLVSQWWLLLLIPILIISLVGTIMWLIVRFALKSLSPPLDARQKSATKEFVSKLESTIETVKTPYPIIIFYVIRDIVMRRDSGFISEITQRSKTLRPDFEELRQLFTQEV